jgi:hypothetical protein
MPKNKHDIEFQLGGPGRTDRQNTFGSSSRFRKGNICLRTYITDVVRLGGGSDR